MTASQVRIAQRDVFLAEAQWTRFYAMSAQASADEKSVANASLVRSEDAIAASVASFVGEQNQAALAKLLHARAQALVTFVAPVSSTFANAQQILLVNAREIAQFFGNLGPAFDVTTIEQELDAQLQATIDGIQARGRNDDLHAASSWDLADQHTLALGDAISAGIAKQYAAQIAPSATSQAQDDVQLALRIAIDEHAFWLRAFVIDHWAKRNAQPALDRAVLADYAFANVFAANYGAATGAQAQYHVHTDTTDATTYVFALDLQSQDAVSGTLQIWNTHAQDFAAFLVTTTGDLRLADVQPRLLANVDHEHSMITARYTQQWDAEVSSYGQTIANWNAFTDVVGGAIAAPIVH